MTEVGEIIFTGGKPMRVVGKEMIFRDGKPFYTALTIEPVGGESEASDADQPAAV
jgi:hypothetical protein